MQESYEKGLAPRSASTFASGAARYLAKSKQRYRWAGYRASKNCNQDADALDFVVIDPDTPGRFVHENGRPRGCLSGNRRQAGARRR
jgi:hypothetical protein